MFIVLTIYFASQDHHNKTVIEGLHLLDTSNVNFPVSLTHMTNNMYKAVNRKSKKVRIFTNMKAGLKYDAEIYAKLIDNNVVCCFFKSHRIPEKEKKRCVDVNIFMEKIWWNTTKIGDQSDVFLPSKENWLVVNQEFLFESINSLKIIDKFLCKSKYALNLIKHFVEKHRLPGSVVYVGHTSISPEIHLKDKDENLFIHAAGQSFLKNTDLLLDVWKDIHKKYPKVRLVVTCNTYCKSVVSSDKLIENGNKSCHENFCKSDCENCRESGGIIYKPFFEKGEFSEYTKKAICYVCPSITEGFGHYINEGRANGSAVITTNAPPMNELVINGKNGLLVDYKQKIPSSEITHFYMKYLPKFIFNRLCCDGSEAFLITHNDLYDVIEKFIQLPYYEKIRMGEAGRKMYTIDAYTFQRNLDELL